MEESGPGGELCLAPEGYFKWNNGILGVKKDVDCKHKSTWRGTISEDATFINRHGRHGEIVLVDAAHPAKLQAFLL